MQYVFGMTALILSTALIGGCRINGANMKTRQDLNTGIDTLSATATALDNSYVNLSGVLNLQTGSLIALGHTAGLKGASVDVPVMFVAGKGNIAALQFDVLLPTGVTFVSAVIGPAGTTAGKSVATNPVTGGVRVIVFGLNQTLISNGELAVLTLQIGTSVASGHISLGITNVVGSDPNGVDVSVTASTGTVKV